jgi:adenylate cyclase
MRNFSRYRARWLLALLFALTGILCLHYEPPAFVQRLDVFLYDLRLRAQSEPLDPRIVIVDIDEKSLDQLGRWPWNRDVVARLVDTLHDQYFARAIGFDVVFSEPDTSSGYKTLETLAENDFKDLPAIAERIEALRPRFDYDAIFATALRERPVVLGYFLSNEANAITKGGLPEPAFRVNALDGRALDVGVARSYTGNLEVLQKAARGGGFMNPLLDEDGNIRRVSLLLRVGDRFYESLALATARVGLGASQIEPAFFSREELPVSDEAYLAYGAIRGLRLNSRPSSTFVPVERNLTALINYRGPGGPEGGQFRYVSAVDVLNGTVPMEHLADNIVLIGTTAAGLKDLRAAPVNPNYPGVEMHANVISSILDGAFKQEPDFSLAIQLIQIVVVGLLLGLLLPVLTPLASILLTLSVTAALTAANYAMYHTLHWVVPVALSLLLAAALFLFNLVWGYLFEYRKGRAMVNLFGEYVAPELVAEMASNPESYSMEGESRELTVLFADVRGFTTISEGLDPNALREYINLYLTAMSEDIRGNRGTLDKYIGDAVMAFWGAPVTLPDHAERAVATTLKMQTSAEALNKDFAQRGWPSLHIGIGLNTGDMRVGDMGSKIRRAYTVMGDAVNLASRLEGITKVYGVGIVVGEATMRAAPAFAYRELDMVRVKGKNEPVPIFEPIGLASEVSEATRATLDRWHAALALVRSQQWDEAERLLRDLQAAEPDMFLYALYLQRIAHFRANPPGENWDGVTTFETK